MNVETRITIILMCAVFTLCSCTKKAITPAEDPQPAEVGFTATSQAVWVKSGETKSASDFLHLSFGVWGIARQGSVVYNLWGNGSLMDVNYNTDKGCYEPEEVAYWLGGYSYNFLALAPHMGNGVIFSEDEDIITLKDSQNPDKLTFAYDMSTQYNQTTPKYDFDLLGASANTGSIAGGRTDSQTLTFYHLFSQVNIGVSFTTGLNGEAIDGRLKRIKLGDICTYATCDMYHRESTNKVYADWTCADDAATMEREYIVSEKVAFTIKADQENAKVTLKAGDQTVTNENGEASIEVSRGTHVEYTVEGTVTDEGKEGKKTKTESGKVLVHRSLTRNIYFASGETRTELHPDWSINVIPQDASNMKLYLDFVLNDNGTLVEYDDFEIVLTFPSDANPQVFNHKYNWNISIGTGAAIKFEVIDVTDWTNVDGGDIAM
jgi:hypothetical protein